MNIDPELLANVNKLPPDQQKEILTLLKQYEEAKTREVAQDDFLAFVRAMWPPFISGRHFEIMAEKFEAIAAGKLKRLIINMPPRHGKSEFSSWLLPAWYIGRFPDQKVIQASHTADLSKDFGRKVRDLIASEEFNRIFPNVSLKADSKAAGRWNTNAGGEYFAVGVGGAMAGKGAHLMIIDDPHNEQEAQTQDPTAFDHVYDWYNTGPRQRLQPGGAICIVMTRWGQKDLTGRIIKAAQQRGDVSDWEVIEFPMELPSGKVLWPQFWSDKEMKALKEELPINRWMAQYQQQPLSEGAAIVKREWWKRWPHDTVPPCEFIIQTWDTAFFAKQQSDYSACTTWGVFWHTDEQGQKRQNIILLDAFKERLEFPALKRKALAMYKEFAPDAFIIEMKASGAPLIFELRAMGIPVGEHHVNRGRAKSTGQNNDKMARVNAVSDMFQSGMVWAPERRFADEVIEEFAAFPVGDNDDLVDASIIALERFRRGGFIQLESDDYDHEPMPRRKVSYY